MDPALALLPYLFIWLLDFEFAAPPGERPRPVCLVARELRTGREVRLWQDELLARTAPPFDVGPDSLFAAYYSSAELTCFLSLGWPLPVNVLDLFVAFRMLTNGLILSCGNSLLGALAYFGLDAMSAVEKKSMQELAQRNRGHGPWKREEREALLDYCGEDVAALKRLLPEIVSRIEVTRTIYHSGYMRAAARMEYRGVPIDIPARDLLFGSWEDIKGQLTEEIDASFGVFEKGSFKTAKFERWLVDNEIPWPLLPSGKLALDDDTFRDMARVDVRLEPLRQLRHALSQMRLADLAVGSDGRNRTMLSAFRARTGRNQPSNAEFIFGPAVWLRGLIRPRGGRALIYLDWEQQEFGIAGALSGDEAMMAAYRSGDPYLAFAKQAGAVPASATKQSHAEIRELFKTCALGVQFAMGATTLAYRLGESTARARELLELHRRTYPTYWRWVGAAVNFAMQFNSLHTVFGWRLYVTDTTNPRALQNFPMQGNGSEMLRLACRIATDMGVAVCAPIHDAVLIEAPARTWRDEVAKMQEAMRLASAIVLRGFELRSEVKVILSPQRYADKRGTTMWNKVWTLIKRRRRGR